MTTEQVTDIELMPIGQKSTDRLAFMKYGSIAASATRQFADWTDSDYGTVTDSTTLSSDRRFEQTDQSTAALVKQAVMMAQNGYSSTTQPTFTLSKSTNGRNSGHKHKRPKETLKTVLDVVGHVDAAQRANNLRELGIDDATIVELTADLSVNSHEKSSVRRRKERRKRAPASTASVAPSNRIGEKPETAVEIVSEGENDHEETANENENSISDDSDDRRKPDEIITAPYLEWSKTKLNSSSKRIAPPASNVATHAENNFISRLPKYPSVPVIPISASGAVTWANVVRKSAPVQSGTTAQEQPTAAARNFTSSQSSVLAQSSSNNSMSSTSSSTSILDRDQAVDESEIDSTMKDDGIVLVTPNDSSPCTSQETAMHPAHFTFGVIELDTQTNGTYDVDALNFQASTWKMNDSERSAILAHFDKAFSKWQAASSQNRAQGRIVEWRDGLCFNQAKPSARATAEIENRTGSTNLTAETTCVQSIRHPKSPLADRTRT